MGKREKDSQLARASLSRMTVEGGLRSERLGREIERREWRNEKRFPARLCLALENDGGEGEKRSYAAYR
ncbi:hypothetical protein VSF3289_00882 [Vibrio scophthalmi]|uniref:Uncharacterized protein n=1 Tax=Vibrio scophthalmi TaxID=45658 RepID=A0A1E3WLI0_9VIBR|nr:hypothetical protein VSF3289_00882 [Vibrio scophthalmi]